VEEKSNDHHASDVIVSLVLSTIPDSILEAEFESELQFHLPTECTPFFPTFFETLENDQKNLGIAKFSVSYTLMQDVFKKYG